MIAAPGSRAQVASLKAKGIPYERTEVGLPLIKVMYKKAN